MERRKPLRRKTPLKVSKAWGSTAPKVGPQAPRRRPRRTRTRTLRTPDGHPACDSWTHVRKVILERAGGRCELCGARVTLESMEGHHRQSRSVGPDCPANGLGLCADCHHRKVHAQPELSIEHGWITSRHQEQPCAQPVYLDQHGWVRLGCDGTIEPLTPGHG